MNPVLPLLINRAIVLVLRGQPAARCSEDYATAIGQFSAKLDPRLLDRLSRRDQSKLGETIVK